MHVDGAFGLWAAASPQLRHLVEGVERADSWATDAHKWLNVPYDCGIAITAHIDDHRVAMHAHAAYVPTGPVRSPTLRRPRRSSVGEHVECRRTLRSPRSGAGVLRTS
ncbi:MAG: pyridoxal-dependent decarboxylase [Candidatus Nanopelagicales bacterium]